MNKIKQIQKAKDFQDYLSQRLKNPRINKYYEGYGKQLEIAYQILKLRKQQKLSQLELARKLKTNQSDIARIESGQQNLTTETLHRLATAFGRQLKIDFVK